MKGKVKHPGKYRSYVGAKNFEGLRASALMRVKAAQSTTDF